MNAHYRLKTPVTWLFIATALTLAAGCAAGNSAYTRGTRAERSRNFEVAMTEYKAALDEDPGNTEYRLKYEQVRFAAAFEHFQNGRRAFERNDIQTARTEFTRTLDVDPTNDLATQELARVEEILASRTRNEPEPEHNIDDLKERTKTDASVESQLDPTLVGPISLMMTQASRTAYETLADLSGLNVIFDPDFRSAPIQIEVNNVTIYDALDILSLQTRSFWQPINRNTILISPDNQTKRREYEEHVLKTIYLTNSVTSTEITEAITALRTLLNMRFIAQSSAMSAILVRDTADRIAIAEKIIQDIDKSKPEVVVEATVLEVDRSLLRELGIIPPQGTALTFKAPGTGTTTTTTTADTTTTTTTEETSTNSISLRNLGRINSGNFSINIPSSVATFLSDSTNSRLVQNPRVRATDGKLASIRIGSRVPIASGSFQPAFVGATGTPVVQFQYVDVGVNMDITPKVLLNRDISMSVVVQVQALNGERNVGGVTQPVFTNRQITHEIRLAEGETNILGGIISDTESVSMNGIPGLKDIPVLKYLFGKETKRREETEIIIVLTPHIVRMPNLTETNMRGIYIGTEVNTQLRSPAPATPAASSTPAATATPAASAPAAASAPGQLRPSPTIVFSPATVTLAPGTPVALNIALNGADVFGADFTLSFDPLSFSIAEVRDGGFLSRDGQIVALVQKVDTEAGTVRVSLERPPGSSTLSGTGNLLALTLIPGARKGESALKIIDLSVRDARRNAQAGAACGGSSYGAMSRKSKRDGFTLVELIVTVAVLAVLVGMAVPLLKNTIQRQRETELRRALREIRTAIDQYKAASDQGFIQIKLGTEGYPEKLDVLVEGVTMVGAVDRDLKFLRRVPIDPMTNSPEWGLRAYQDDATSASWGGQNVFDIYTKSGGTALDGTLYKDW